VPVAFQEERFDGNCTGNYTLSRAWSAVDECDNPVEAWQWITVEDNTAPVVDCPADVVLECPAAIDPATTGAATGSDTCGEVVITYNDVTVLGCGNAATTARAWTATDECALASSCEQVITVADTTAPAIISLDGAPLVQEVGFVIDFEAYFEDDCGAPHVVTWDFGDGSDLYIIDPAGSPTSASHVYTASGIHELALTVTDDCGNQATETLVLVVFDPANGFADGARWFIPDEDTIVAGDPWPVNSLRASFRFMVKYRPGDSTPDGSLLFQFKPGDIKLRSIQLDWLVISRQYIHIKGLATINGQGEYAFRVTAWDVGEPGIGNDEFKVEAWIGDLDTENNPPTPHHRFHGVLGGGNIVAHE